MTARAEGNPYFTPHLIPTVTISQFNLKQLLTEFNKRKYMGISNSKFSRN